MTADAARRARTRTLELVREALRTGELTHVERVLAADVRWYGSGPGGGCRSRGEVLETLGAALTGDLRPRPRDARLVGEHAVLHVTRPAVEQDDEGDEDSWFVLRLDEDGLIGELQGYSSEAAAEHDLAILASGRPAPPPDAQPAAVSGLVPVVHVADLARSLAFYRLLGFEALETHESDVGELVWAFLRSGDASLMLARTAAPLDHRAQAVFFYLYSDQLERLRDELVADGLAPGEIVDGSPGPRQEMLVADPDGYVLMVAQIEVVAAG